MHKYIALLVILTCAVCNTALAEDHAFTDTGNITNAELLNRYVGSSDQTAANYYVDNWIDGWLDGMFSIYVYDGVLDREGLSALYECVNRRFPTASHVRRDLLSWGSDPDLKVIIVSRSLYLAVRYACTDVLGEVIQQKESTES